MQVHGLGVGALGMPGLDREGGDLLLVWAALHFELPAPGHVGPLALAPEQPPPSAAPLWFGEPGLSSPLWESPIAYRRDTSEVHVRANAHGPAGTRVRELVVGVRVGVCMQQAIVLGERHWTAALEPSVPLPFESLPLVWEHAFGGRSSTDERCIDMRNPIGVGMYAGIGEAIGRPLPAIEHPGQRIRSIGDRPEPLGFLPRGTAWAPRSRLAGTYDQAWVETRCPLWPLDFDERYFLAAPPALVAPERLRGGEPVVLLGMHPEGTIAFELPAAAVTGESRFVDRRVPLELALDIVRIDVVAGRLSLVYRATVPASRRLEQHVETVVQWRPLAG